MSQNFHTSTFTRDQDLIISPSEIRIILWDIDGTLMRSTRQGAFREYFEPVMKEVYGSAGDLAGINASGMTDTQIFYEALRGEGFTPEQIHAPKERLLKVFKAEMTRVVAENEHTYELLPGVPEILEATSENPQFLNALLTGNLSVAAEIKLRFVDLWRYFKSSPNIFGELSHDRRELGKSAVKTFTDFLNFSVKPEQFIVVGDTPNDIVAARAFGAKVISVATGRIHSTEELSEYQPDLVLEDLSDTQKVLETLESI